MLDIIKASAGSGKTYQLTYDYIKLLLSEKDKNTGRNRLRRDISKAHRSILAITFTNKATDEMKARILHELTVLASMVRGWKKESPYMGDLEKELGATRPQIARAAGEALRRLLFDFDFFQVSTIDSFFQMVLRTFAREANLTGNYEIALESGEAVEWAVGEFLDSLRTDPTSRRTHDNINWITEYLLDRLRQGMAVNLFNRSSALFGSLVSFMKRISNETYMLNKKEMDRFFGERSNMQNLVSFLRREIDAAEKIIPREGQAALALIDRCEGMEGFSPGRNTRGMFALAAGGTDNLKKLTESKTLINGVADASTLFNKKHTDEASIRELGERCAVIYDAVKRLVLYRSMNDNAFYLGIISEIERYIEKYRKETNTLLLSDTNTLLNTIMEGSDTPFVYERIGIRLRHFLIDEFQDTSRMQWENLRPLISQGMSEGNDSLIIGDEKQCIYRFRNSDPTLLQSAVTEEFKPFVDQAAIDSAKNTNWRSSAEVVRFNNALFDPASSALTGAFRDIYQKARQEVARKNRQGYVCVTAVRGNMQKGRKDLQERCLEIMATNIRREIHAGYRPCDIAVLTRFNATAQNVIDYISCLFAGSDDPLLRNVRIVSDDALALGKSPAVRFMVSVLRFCAMPPEPPLSERESDGKTPRITRRDILMLINRYEYNVNGNMLPAEALEDAMANFTVMPDITENFDSTAAYSLQSLVEQITRLLSEERRRDEAMFISAFQDLVADYCESNDPDIHSFLQWWDSAGCGSKVSAPADENAIRVMTAHKSKGLEFRCVHVPDAAWDFVKFKDLEWFDTSGLGAEIPCSLPPVYPFVPKSWMSLTPLKERYESRVAEQTLDELNVLYVTLTRAVDELIVSYPAPSKPRKEISTTGDFLDASRSALMKAGVDFSDVQVEIDRELFPPDDGSASSADGEMDVKTGIEYSSFTVGHALPHALESEEEARKTLEPERYFKMPPYYSLPRTDLWRQLRIETPGETVEEMLQRTSEVAVESSRPDTDKEKGALEAVMARMLRTVFTSGQLGKSASRLVASGAADKAMADEAVERLRRQIESDGLIRSWFEGYDHCRPYAVYTVEYHDALRRLPGVRIVWHTDGQVDAILCTPEADATPTADGFGFPLKAVRHFLDIQGHDKVRCFVWNLATGTVIPLR